VPAELQGLPGGGFHLAHAAVDSHATGARANHLALRWLGKDGHRLDPSGARAWAEALPDPALRTVATQAFAGQRPEP